LYGTDHERASFLKTAYEPVGVAKPAFPEDMCITRTTTLSSIARVSWRSSSTSTRWPPGPLPIGTGLTARSSAALVSGPTIPSAALRRHFWKAITAKRV
jgi:hypothetical protein